MELSNQFFLFIAMVVFLCINFGAAVAQAQDQHQDFSFKFGAWNGPDHWGDIHKNWETCKIGRMQSPVAIVEKKVMLVHRHDLQWSYLPKKAMMKNLGHNIVIEWEDDVGAVWINKIDYSLKQVHWHMPSEHTINGHRFALEVHLLHQRVTDLKMAMVSILYKVGNPDPFFTKVENHIRTISRKMDAKVDLGIVDPKEISRAIEKYYRLNGSVTIPPCTEGVTWSINRKIRTISREQLKLLKDVAIVEYAENTRPLQSLNDRVIQLFG